MRLTCLIQTIASKRDDRLVRDGTVLQNAILDARNGALFAVDSSNALLDERLRHASSVSILIGEHEFELPVDPESTRISDRALHEYQEAFQTLHQAQRILGIDGDRVFH